uniref:NADH dehydrogenase subunit 6 n=1 Tax=Gargara minuta TaxID=3021816 RepID=UPI00237C2014|nr:NADH dehydrogenase subunit 6 [Gargara minuta]WBV77338.1 NADH dehydrogenase subunit 6 [Gargara minuta]
MKPMFIKLMTMIAITSTMLKMPMSMTLMLMTQTILTISLMNMINSSSWIPLITFLTLIGGLLVIFMYMSSITSNEKFKFNFKLIPPILMIFIMTDETLFNFPTQEFQTINNNMNNMMSMNKMYSKSMMMTIMMVMYLLLTMISINKIIKLFEGPLRSKTYE